MTKKRVTTFLLSVALIIGVGMPILYNLFQADAEESRLTLTAETLETNVDTPYSFQVKVNQSGPDDVFVLHYPNHFQLNLERIQALNDGKIAELNNNATTSELTFKLNASDQPVDLQIEGQGQTASNGQFMISDQIGEQSNALAVVFKASEEEKQKDATTSTDVSDNPKDTTVQPEKPLDPSQAEADNGDTPESRAVAVPDFDWNLLNSDGLDLSSYTEVTENTPVKLTGGAFDTQQRNYYLFFGHVGSANRYTYATESFTKTGNMLYDLSKKKTPILSPMMIGVKKQVDASVNTILFGYDYDYASSAVGRSTANFDIGVMDDPNGQILKSGTNAVDPSTFIVSQYIKDNEIVAYGFVGKTALPMITTLQEYQPVRVHGYVVDQQKGRIRYDVSFYNDEATDKYYAVTYGAHIDVGGNHTSSKLYSYGKDGIYFDEPTKTLADKLPARIYFYMNGGYENTNGPNALKTGNLANSSYQVSYWNKIQSQSWTNKIKGSPEPYEPWDPYGTVDELYKLSHPIFAFRWDPIKLSPNSVGKASLDLSITEPSDTEPPKITLTQTDGKYSGGDYTISGEWSDVDSATVDLYYQIDDGEPIKFSPDAANAVLGNPNKWSFVIPAAQLKAGEPHTIKVFAKDPDEQASNMPEVHLAPGTLDFVSAPSVLDFGQDLKVSNKAESYPLQVKTGDLTVKDNRVVGSSWSMTAKLLTELTSPSNKTLANSLYYQHDGKTTAFSLLDALPVYDHISTNNDLFDISAKWAPTTEKGQS